MNTIKCPECKLVNMANARVCRRCSTPLIPEEKGKAIRSQTSNFGKVACGLAIAAVVIILAFWIYRPSRKEPDVLTSAPAAALEKGAVINKAQAGPDLEAAKKLSRDFVARVDQNMTDRSGHGFEKNQALAFDTLKILREQSLSFADPAAQKHSDEFSRLLQQYYNQLTTYNADTTTLSASSQRMKDNIEQIQQDASLSPEEKTIRQREIQRKYLDESEQYNGTSKDIDATMLALRSLASGS